MIRVEGHFGELLQGRLGRLGPVVLVTLPCPSLSITARHIPGAGLTIHGHGQRLLTPARAHALLSRLGCPLTGRILLHSQMPAGGGAGASTAALIAVAKLAGATDTNEIARACIAVEGASDPLMFEEPSRRLWASRLGKTVSILPRTPKFEVVGGFLGAPVRTRAEDEMFPDISDLIEQWPGKDLSEMAALTTASARRTLAFRGIEQDLTEGLAHRLGAVGWMIAHTGSARGLIFERGHTPRAARAALRDAGLRNIVAFGAGHE